MSKRKEFEFTISGSYDNENKNIGELTDSLIKIFDEIFGDEWFGAFNWNTNKHDDFCSMTELKETE